MEMLKRIELPNIIQPMLTKISWLANMHTTLVSFQSIGKNKFHTKKDPVGEYYLLPITLVYLHYNEAILGHIKRTQHDK